MYHPRRGIIISWRRTRARAPPVSDERSTLRSETIITTSAIIIANRRAIDALARSLRARGTLYRILENRGVPQPPCALPRVERERTMRVIVMLARSRSEPLQ